MQPIPIMQQPLKTLSLTLLSRSPVVLFQPPCFAIISEILQEKLKHKTGFSQALESYSIRDTHIHPDDQ